MLRSALCDTTGVPFLFLLSTDIKQLLDEVFVKSGMFKVEVSVISRAELQVQRSYRSATLPPLKL